jgi:PhnB protein
MATDLSAYIHFDGRTREAMQFYQSVFGGAFSLERYGDYGLGGTPADADKIIYGVLHSPDGFVLRGTDLLRAGDTPQMGNRWALCLNGDNEGLLTRAWEALCPSGTVVKPLIRAAWGDQNGVLVDRFGVTWIVNIGTSK